MYYWDNKTLNELRKEIIAKLVEHLIPVCSEFYLFENCIHEFLKRIEARDKMIGLSNIL